VKISRRKIIELIRESAGEMRSREAIAHAQSMREDGLSFEDFITILLGYLEDQTNQQWSEEMLPEDWNFYDEWIEGADPLSIATEYIQDSAQYYMENKMKTTKSQLRRIIKEEKAKIHEQSTPTPGTTGMEIQPSIDAIEDILNGLYEDGLENADLIKLLEGIILDINRGFVGEPS